MRFSGDDFIFIKLSIPLHVQEVSSWNLITCLMSTVLNIGKKLYEGKTKEVYELLDCPGQVLLQSKDQITAGNAARKNHMEGKAAISNKTTSCIFELLRGAGEWLSGLPVRGLWHRLSLMVFMRK